MELTSTIIFLDTIFVISIIICILYFIVFYNKEGEVEYLWVLKLGSSMLFVDIFLLMIYRFRPISEQKRELNGFEAWTEKVDLDIERILRTNPDTICCCYEPTFNYNEDQRYQISNQIIALSIKLDKNSTNETIDNEIINVRDELIKKGIRIRKELIKEIYDEIEDITIDEYRVEITEFFNRMQQERESSNRELTVEDLLVPYIVEQYPYAEEIV